MNLKNNNWKNYLGFLLFGLVFVYSLFWIKQGLDLTDEGFTISKSYFMFNGLLKENIDYIGGTSFLSGLWLKLVGSPFIIWERIGYCLIISMIALTSYKILSNYFDKILTALSIFATAIFVRMNIQTINYNVLPGLIILLSIFFVYKALEEKESVEIKKKYFYLILSGFLLGFSIFTRFTLITYLFLNFLFFFIYYYLKKDKKIIKDYLANLSGIFLSIVIIFIMLLMLQIIFRAILTIFQICTLMYLQSNSTNAINASTTTHSIFTLLPDYLNPLSQIIFYYIIFIHLTIINYIYKK